MTRTFWGETKAAKLERLGPKVMTPGEIPKIVEDGAAAARQLECMLHWLCRERIDLFVDWGKELTRQLEG